MQESAGKLGLGETEIGEVGDRIDIAEPAQRFKGARPLHRKDGACFAKIGDVKTRAERRP